MNETLTEYIKKYGPVMVREDLRNNLKKMAGQTVLTDFLPKPIFEAYTYKDSLGYYKCQCSHFLSAKEMADEICYSCGSNLILVQPTYIKN